MISDLKDFDKQQIEDNIYGTSTAEQGNGGTHPSTPGKNKTKQNKKLSPSDISRNMQ